MQVSDCNTIALEANTMLIATYPAIMDMSKFLGTNQIEE